MHWERRCLWYLENTIPNSVVIIDSFESFIDRPTNLLACEQQYKHHHTAKYLIGILPQSGVNYIFNGWGGRKSDKVHHWKKFFLSLIYTDRGFEIHDSVGAYCSKLVLPAFTKGKSQLSGIKVEQTSRIANVRIHVERVIGNIRKKFSFLSGP